MDITINSLILGTEFWLLNQIVNPKATLPILSHVLLEAEPMVNQLALYATNLEVWMTARCPAVVKAPGRMAVPAKTLGAIVEQFTNTEVNITLDKTKALVSAPALHFTSRLQALPADEFPTLPAVEGETIALPMADFQALIGRTRYAISDKPGKYVLDGALLSLNPDKSMAALITTDGRRLAVATMSYAGTKHDLVVPSKTLDLLAAMEGSGAMQVSQSANHLFFTYGDRVIISRKLEGQFPNYVRIIPQENKLSVAINRSAMIYALRRILAVAGEDQAIYLTFFPNALEITAHSAEVGEADERIDVTYAGPEIKLCVNGKYVLDFFSAASESVVNLLFKDADTALLLMDGPEAAKANFFNVVMMMKV